MKKTHELTLDKTIEFAQQQYQNHKTISGRPLMEHCQSVARAAEAISHKLYQDVRPDYFPDSTKDNIVAIVHGSILHDVFNVGFCAFEQVAEITTVQIAATVADISRDYRLVETKRDMEFRGRLSQSPVWSQIIATADIICTGKEMLKLLKDGEMEHLSRIKKMLAQLDGDLLSIHAANKYHVLRMYVHAAKNLLTDISQQIKNCKQQAKMARVVANATKSLREKIASTKAKERKNGRKKSASTNS